MIGKKGRPRSFDTSEKLEHALHVFWRSGYIDSSMQTLGDAMGLSKPSIYAAYGDKADLYLHALQRYVETEIGPKLNILKEKGSCQTVVRKYFESFLAMMTDAKKPGGCFIVTGSLGYGSDNLPKNVEHQLRLTQTGHYDAIVQRLKLGKKMGDLDPSVHVEDAAKLLMSLLIGMAVQARAGEPYRQLHRLLQLALPIAMRPA